jgi:ADP-heptose:LPS heptosyltransferase
VLALRPGALGDTLLALPALRALRRAGMRVALAADGAAARLLEDVHEVARGLAFDDPSLAWLFTGQRTDQPGEAPMSAGLRSEEPVVAWMTGSPPGLPSGALLAPSRPPNMDQHCARFLLGTLAPLGIDLAWDDRTLEVTAVPSDEVLVHPGSGSATKNWPAEQFATVIRALDRPIRLVVGEADASPVARLEACLGFRPPRLERAPLEALAARLAGCHAYLGNDSGVSHLAGVCGAHTLVVFGPTDPDVWRPLGPDVTVVTFDTPPSEVVKRLW